jgi:hypothetical protein
MKSLSSLLFAFLFIAHVEAQMTFEKIISKGTSERGWSVIPTAEGGYAFLGDIIKSPTCDRWLVVTNYAGDTLWSKTFYGIGTDMTGDRALVQSADSGFTFIANRNGKINLLHTSSTGDSIWEKEMCEGVGYSLSPTSDQGYVITGRDFTSTKVLVTTTNSQGDLVWSKDYHLVPPGFMTNYTSWSIKQAPDGGFIVAGEYQGFAFSIPYMLRIAASGDSLWYHAYWYSTLYDGKFYSVTATENNCFIACGHVIVPYDDGMVMKVDGNGDTLWYRTLYHYGLQSFYSIRNTPDGGVVLCGSYGDQWFTNKVFLAKLSSSGDVLWEKQLGNYDRTTGLCVEPTTDNGYIISGQARLTPTSNYQGLLIKTDGEGNITGISEDKIQPLTRVFPNPVQDFLNIECKEECFLSIYNQLGRSIFEKSIRQGVVSFDVSFLSTGFYCIKLFNEHGILYTGKIFKSDLY